MKAVTPVLLSDPSGVERELRFTPGSRKRIFERFGTENIVAIFQERGDWSIFEVAYYMLFDTTGKPPGEMTVEQWMEFAAGDDAQEVVAAVMSAVTQGKTPKNEISEMLDKVRAMQQTGSIPGPSAVSVSDLPKMNSGGDTPTENLPLSSNSTETKSETEQS